MCVYAWEYKHVCAFVQGNQKRLCNSLELKLELVWVTQHVFWPLNPSFLNELKVPSTSEPFSPACDKLARLRFFLVYMLSLCIWDHSGLETGEKERPQGQRLGRDNFCSLIATSHWNPSMSLKKVLNSRHSAQKTSYCAPWLKSPNTLKIFMS